MSSHCAFFFGILLTLLSLKIVEPLLDTVTNNDIRTRVHAIRRDRTQDSLVSSSSSTNFAHNLTKILDSVGNGCKQYCGDQTQYNTVCLSKGCAEWKSALKDGCFATCTGVDSSYRENYACQIGCSRAVEDYHKKVSTLLLPLLEPPTLISNSLKSSSLRLTWEGGVASEALPYVSYTVQRRTLTGLWETLPPTNGSVINVVNLKPYTQYRFRVGWILASDLDPLYSRESNPILTLEKGLPSAPQVTSIQPISNTSVAVTWNPPVQPNGRLVAYILKLQPILHPAGYGHAVIKEIPTSQNPRGYTFSGLQPLTNYSLAVSAQNREGEGESANVQFTTPEQGSLTLSSGKSPEPRLLVQSSKDVYFQPLDLLMEPEVPIFNSSSHNVTAVAFHMKRAFIFIATSDGEIQRVRLKSKKEKDTSPSSSPVLTIISKERLELGVAHLSVDWLHNKLYIVGKQRRSTTWVIKRCDLDGNALATIYTKLISKPLYFAADPFTGYLYWVSQPSQYRGGLYKLNLTADEYAQAKAVLEDNELGPFTLDVANYRILIIHKGRNTVLSVSLDGDISDIRSNTQAPQWNEALSLTMNDNGILFGNTPTSILTEEYNGDTDSYYQNRFDVPKNLQPLGKLLMFHPSSQPIPVPMAAPQNLQVIYSQNKARISWRPPPTISALGAGAWCDWHYHLRISDNRSYTNITSTSFTLEGLKPSNFYSVQIQAYSEAGRGPMSPMNRGKTLRETSYNVSLLWGSVEGSLYSTDTLGEDLHLVASSPGAKGGMQSIAWGESGIIFAVGNGSVFYHGVGDNSVETSSLIRGISYAQSIAFDYIGQRLYWSNPTKQTIYRCLLENSSYSSYGCAQRETLHIVTMAREISVDSYKGLLLWSTGHSIEMSRMNGYAHGILFQNGLFSGKQIVGMTLDTEQSRIYWITRSASGSTLQRMQYNIRGAQMPMVIAHYEDTPIIGPIRYFNDRLLWIQNESEAVIADVLGQSTSSLRLSTVSNITNIFVKDQSNFRYPGGLPKTKIQVNPNAVTEESVRIKGVWTNFTIIWDPVDNTNYGKVLYEVMVNNGVVSRITEGSNISMALGNSSISPFSEITISITALTYWSTSRVTMVKLRTPEWKPSEPRNLRVYIEPELSFPFEKKDSALQLRWDPPRTPNGVVLGYILQCLRGRGEKSVKFPCHCELGADRSSCILKTDDLKTLGSTMYQFSISAYTKAGPGQPSKKISIDPQYQTPVPLLFLTTPDQLQILDIDRNKVDALSLGYVSPITATFSAKDNEVFWFSEGQDLIKSRVKEGPGYNKSRILSLDGKWEASHLTLDWIGRKLYWAVETVRGKGSTYGIMVYDMARMDHNLVVENEDDHLSSSIYQPQLVVTSNNPVKSLGFNPFRNALYWTSPKRFGVLALYTAESMDNFTVKPFLSRHSAGEDDSSLKHCNCTHVPVTGETIFFDPTGYPGLGRSLLFQSTQSIWATDEEGCVCVEVKNISNINGTLHLLAGDVNHIYCGTSGSILYTIDKRGSPGGGVAELQVSSSGVRELQSYGTTAQPFPPQECLIPTHLDPETPLLFNHSSHSLHLQLPGVKVSSNCSELFTSLPSPTYSVYYGTVEDDLISKCTPTSPSFCKVIRTLSSSLHVRDLHPYTTYTVFVEVSTKYNTSPLLCAPIMLRTAPGAPMPPEVPKLTPLTPTKLRVEWKRPEKLNGEKVWYEVHWKTMTAGSSIAKWAETETTRKLSLTTDLLDLTPSSNYSVWIRAFSEKGDAFSDSPANFATTFPLPSNLSRRALATPHTLSLSWIPPADNSIIMHQFLFREATSSARWVPLARENFTIPGKQYNITITSLKPKSLYEFKLRAWYSGDPGNPFIFPTNGSMLFETKADKPGGVPSPPIARGIGKALYEVSWSTADENGAQIEMYSLEAKLISQQVQYNFTPEMNRQQAQHRSPREASETGRGLPHHSPAWYLKQWVEVYTGKDTRWVVDDALDPRNIYSFRVRAKNAYGWGPYSNESEPVSLVDLTLVAEPEGVGIIVATIFLSFLILVVLAIFFVLVYRRQYNEKPSAGVLASSSDHHVELATLRELPGGTSFIHSNNMLYLHNAGMGVGSDLLIDLEGIPKVKWNQLHITKLLGEGAFGKVYEASAVLEVAHPEVRVAVKTLRKSANSSEKLEFAQEAKLMAQFKHPHIIRLIGICVDTDPCYLLLEFMGEGDLLKFLRNHRPSGGTQPSLTLTDLLEMCVDVAKGCVYLEDLHFVHRDIAARNCLVSVIQEDENKRVVKIGDFGLARDIYRNDYYRKDGEGLLPVRWMAPESLVDGIFTTQSDVWSFGVLLWEIMTLGNQPYPAMTNVDVLNYVRQGGRLQRPPHCPQILGDLMTLCWEYGPDNRPTFKDCLTQLELIHRQFQENVRTFAYPHYSSHSHPSASHPPNSSPSGFHVNDIQYDPYSYSDGGGGTSTYHLRHDSDSVFEDDQGNHHHHPPFHQRIPNYLEVLSEENRRTDWNHPTDEGYEIPLPKLPPRLEIGLPSPPPSASASTSTSNSYWNAETLPLRHHHHQYRNLLPSATSSSEEPPLELEVPLPPGSSCGIHEHHYLSNNVANGTGTGTSSCSSSGSGDETPYSRHLRGVPCQYVKQKAKRNHSPPVPPPTLTIFDNKMYHQHQTNTRDRDEDEGVQYRTIVAHSKT